MGEGFCSFSWTAVITPLLSIRSCPLQLRRANPAVSPPPPEEEAAEEMEAQQGDRRRSKWREERASVVQAKRRVQPCVQALQGGLALMFVYIGTDLKPRTMLSCIRRFRT